MFGKVLISLALWITVYIFIHFVIVFMWECYMLHANH
jgi:hypothetical protein